MIGGELVTLEQQDRSRWDTAAIAEALALAQLPGTVRGSYRIQADLATLHATARSAANTDWPAMVSLYDELLELVPSPVVALNQAIAVGMSDGPLAGVAALDDLAAEPRLRNSHLLPAARADPSPAPASRPRLCGLLTRRYRSRTDQERRQLLRRRDELASEIGRP